MALGDGPLKPAVEALVRKLQLDHKIRLFGAISNVEDYLNMADLFIHSSKGEGCSNAILEAMHAGLPAIVSDTGGTAEIIKPSYGELFRYKDCDSLFEKLESVLFVRDLRKMSENAKLTAKSKFDVNTMVDNYYTIIGDILQCNLSAASE